MCLQYLLVVSSLFTVLLTFRSVAVAEVVRIGNKRMDVQLEPSDGSFSIADKSTGRHFIQTARLAGGAGEAKVTQVQLPNLGAAQALQLSRANSDDQIMLVEDLPFALIRTTWRNNGSDVQVHNKIKTASFELDLGQPPSVLRAQGTHDHVVTPDKNPGSYAYLAIADPKTRNGVVFGWLSHDRGSGVVLSSVAQDRVKVDGQIDYGALRIAPGKSADSEILAVGYFDDARLGLEAWADAVAKFYAIKLPPQPAGYCTWYSDRNGGASDEKHLIELAKFAKENLAAFGFNFVQIDDKWQIGKRREGPSKDFTGANPTGPYPGGMKQAADQLKQLGMTPGIWFIPFAGDHQDPMYKDHQDWFVKRKDGSVWETKWGGTSLDMTNPAARDHLRSVVKRIAGDWGYTYFKMDGLYTGTATKQVYVNDGYEKSKGPDEIGDAVFHDPNVTNIEAYRAGLKLVREAAGPNVFFLGCNVSQNMRTMGGSFGLLDAMRIGPDNGAPWDRLTRGPEHGSRKYFLHGRVWYNDPDPVYVRNSIPLNHARLIASWAGISGQLFTDSDWLPTAAPDRIEILKRTMAPHRLLPRPVDFFDTDVPRIWLLTDTRNGERKDVVALYNWDSKTADIKAKSDWIGLPKAASYIAFDFWDNTFLPPFSDELSVSVPKQSCRILSVRPMLDRPQVVSTSRHVAQGMVDELEQKWDPATSTLSGAANVIANDPYELRLATLGPDGTSWRLIDANIEQYSGQRSVDHRESGGFARVTFTIPVTGRMIWSIRFDSKPRKLDSELARVDNLRSRADGTRAVSLSWQAPAADGVVYEIHRDDGKVAKATGSQWIDDSVEKGKTYNYLVTTADFFGRHSDPAGTTVTIPKSLDPGPTPPKPDAPLAKLTPATVRPNTLEVKPTSAGAIALPIGARVVYDRDPKFKHFVAVVSSDGKPADGAAICRIINDDGEDIAATAVLAETPVLPTDTQTWNLSVELPENCKRVHVVIDRADDGSKPVMVNLTEAGFVGK